MVLANIPTFGFRMYHSLREQVRAQTHRPITIIPRAYYACARVNEHNVLDKCSYQMLSWLGHTTQCHVYIHLHRHPVHVHVHNTYSMYMYLFPWQLSWLGLGRSLAERSLCTSGQLASPLVATRHLHTMLSLNN